MAELMSRLLWSRLGAESDAAIAVDSVGAAMFDGGLARPCVTSRGSARVVQRGQSMTGEADRPGMVDRRLAAWRS